MVQKSVIAVVDPVPDQRHDDAGQNRMKINNHAVNIPAPDVPVTKEREYQRQKILNSQRQKGDDARILHGKPKNGIVGKDVLKIFKAHESDGRGDAVPVGDGQIKHVEIRVKTERGKKKERRKDKKIIS